MSKLVELRSKTDRQLVEIITRTLDSAVSLARNPDFHGQAERACDDVRRLLPYIPRVDRRRLEARLDELTELLRPRAHAVCY